jgi:alpha-beta hydrolase superfamily lysophospholipase
MEHCAGNLMGDDGTKLYYQSWQSDSEARAVVAILHGIGGHSGMFGHAAECLVPQGYRLYGLDLRGHGRSDGTRGHVRSWDDYRGDVTGFLRMIREANTTLPLFLMGHSMGAVIALDYVLRSPEGFSGIITSAAPLGAVHLPAHLLTISRVLSSLAPRTSFTVDQDLSRSSRDPEALAVYAQDTLRHSKGTARLGTEFTAAVDRVNANAANLRLPLLMLHGTGDRLAAVEGSRAFFAKVPGPDKEYREYAEAYHELHNDINYREVFADIADWLGRHSAGTR